MTAAEAGLVMVEEAMVLGIVLAEGVVKTRKHSLSSAANLDREAGLDQDARGEMVRWR